MKRTIIGFSGPIGAGKTTAAESVKWLGFERVRFAGPLKAMMAALGLTPAEIDGPLKEKPCALLGGKTPRYAMQTIGTEWGRDIIDSQIWVNAWRRAVDKLTIDTPVVVDDVRFPNEAAIIHELNGIIIEVVRDGTGGQPVHASERREFVPDYRLQNGDIDIFRGRVVALASARLQLQSKDAA